MKPERASMLSQLLKEMRRDRGDYYPKEIWLDVHQIFALPYVELVIPRNADGKWEIFLVQRPETDPYWPATWHLPGGLWRTHQTEVQACRSVARRELRVGVKFVDEIMTSKWRTHPYGNPISHVCVCIPTKRLRNARDRKYFRQLPRPFIPEQIAFVEAAWSYLGGRSSKSKKNCKIQFT